MSTDFLRGLFFLSPSLSELLSEELEEEVDFSRLMALLLASISLSNFSLVFALSSSSEELSLDELDEELLLCLGFCTLDTTDFIAGFLSSSELDEDDLSFLVLELVCSSCLSLRESRRFSLSLAGIFDLLSSGSEEESCLFLESFLFFSVIVFLLCLSGDLLLSGDFLLPGDLLLSGDFLRSGDLLFSGVLLLSRDFLLSGDFFFSADFLLS